MTPANDELDWNGQICSFSMGRSVILQSKYRSSAGMLDNITDIVQDGIVNLVHNHSRFNRHS